MTAPRRAWTARLSLMTISLILGLLVVAQLRTRNDIARVASNDDWDHVVAELAVGNARMRNEIDATEKDVAELRRAEGAAAVAPPLVAALAVIGQAGDVVRGALALFALSFGMGAPLLLVGVAGGRLLPKAGPWMSSLKALFGVMFLGVAVWMLGRVLPGPFTLAPGATPTVEVTRPRKQLQEVSNFLEVPVFAPTR